MKTFFPSIFFSLSYDEMVETLSEEVYIHTKNVFGEKME